MELPKKLIFEKKKYRIYLKHKIVKKNKSLFLPAVISVEDLVKFFLNMV